MKSKGELKSRKKWLVDQWHSPKDLSLFALCRIDCLCACPEILPNIRSQKAALFITSSNIVLFGILPVRNWLLNAATYQTKDLFLRALHLSSKCDIRTTVLANDRLLKEPIINHDYDLMLNDLSQQAFDTIALLELCMKSLFKISGDFSRAGYVTRYRVLGQLPSISQWKLAFFVPDVWFYCY